MSSNDDDVVVVFSVFRIEVRRSSDLWWWGHYVLLLSTHCPTLLGTCRNLVIVEHENFFSCGCDVIGGGFIGHIIIIYLYVTSRASE